MSTLLFFIEDASLQECNRFAALVVWWVITQYTEYERHVHFYCCSQMVIQKRAVMSKTSELNLTFVMQYSYGHVRFNFTNFINFKFYKFHNHHFGRLLRELCFSLHVKHIIVHIYMYIYIYIYTYIYVHHIIVNYILKVNNTILARFLFKLMHINNNCEAF